MKCVKCEAQSRLFWFFYHDGEVRSIRPRQASLIKKFVQAGVVQNHAHTHILVWVTSKLPLRDIYQSSLPSTFIQIIIMLNNRDVSDAKSMA